MPSTDIQANFPNVASRLVDQGGRIDQAWLQLLIALWNRTGGGIGVSNAELAAQIIDLQDQIDNIPNPPPIPIDDIYARLDDLAKLVLTKMVNPDDVQSQLDSLASSIVSITNVITTTVTSENQVRFAPILLLGGM